MATYPSFTGKTPENTSATGKPTTGFVKAHSAALPWDAAGIKLGGDSIKSARQILASMGPAPAYTPKASFR